MLVKRHPFDPISFVLGLAFASLGLFFLFGDRSVADIGAQWIWPFPVLLVGVLAVVYAVRRMLPPREPGLAGVGGSEHEGDETADSASADADAD